MRLPSTTTRRLILAIVGIALLLWLSRLGWGVVVQTWYVPGYDERRFHTVSQGMSPAQVEAAAGQPAFKRLSGKLCVGWVQPTNSQENPVGCTHATSVKRALPDSL